MRRLTTLFPSEFLEEHAEELDEVAVPNAVDADIDRFRDVMIAGGTMLRLHEFLSDQFEARHEEQAAAKLHLLHNATEQTIERIDTADEKTHDSTLFKTGPWLENRLMLFDLAYFKYRRHSSLVKSKITVQRRDQLVESSLLFA